MISTRRPRTVAALLASLAVVLACSDSAGPSAGDELAADELFILPLASGAPPLESGELSFYAKKGEKRSGRLYFQDGAGGRGEELLSLEIDDKALRTRPDGTKFEAGDSVLIILRAVDAAKLLFEFAPSGLGFDSKHPAKLKINYAKADTTARRGNDDDDDDHHHDHDEDEDVETRLGIWRQEGAGTPFIRLGTAVLDDEDEVEADLQGFSRYAVGY